MSNDTIPRGPMHPDTLAALDQWHREVRRHHDAVRRWLSLDSDFADRLHTCRAVEFGQSAGAEMEQACLQAMARARHASAIADDCGREAAAAEARWREMAAGLCLEDLADLLPPGGTLRPGTLAHLPRRSS